MAAKRAKRKKPAVLAKASTGIHGLDEITCGGFPRGRPTLVCGGPGSGKTMLGLEFLARGALQYNEPGILVSFEETEEELAQNAISLGIDLRDLALRKKLLTDYIYIERSEFEETGAYDLEGLFIRLGYAIDSIKARRVVLDSIEALFSGIPDLNILRAEVRRLFRWLKKKGVTAVVTAERGDGALTRHGLEEYISDCVILLDNRVVENIPTRRLRIIKYRGSTHGMNEFPFLITEDGISVLPITSAGLDYSVSSQRISSGIKRLDTMMSGKGFYRGSSILVSGTAGSGKSSVAASMASDTCRRGERCIYFAFEESSDQVIRNMRSIGIDLEQWVKKGRLMFHAVRPTVYGLETHLSIMHNLIKKFNPSTVIVDPISNLITVGTETETKSTLMRLIDFLKEKQITSMFTDLTHGGDALEQTREAISSLMDTWLLLRDIELGGERNRGIYVLKSRGMAHSNQIREFLLSDKGIDIVDVYLGPGGVLTGSARVAQEAREKMDELSLQQENDRRKQELERKRHSLAMQVDSINAEIAVAAAELKNIGAVENKRITVAADARKAMGRLRKVDK
jgi:circadian clock protein KaiC